MKIFIHIPKNGGMSIRRGVRDRVILATPENHISREYSENVLATMNQHGEHHGYEHARWRDLDIELREKHRAFAIVRNPWSRTVSRYTFSRKAEGDKYRSFRHFLDDRLIHGETPYFWHRAVRGWYPQKDYVTHEGELRCDVLRLGTDDVQNYLGLDEPIPIRNVSGNGDYRSYYGTEEHRIVADWYAEDIEYFGFSFDSHATRNIWKPS